MNPDTPSPAPLKFSDALTEYLDLREQPPTRSEWVSMAEISRAGREHDARMQFLLDAMDRATGSTS